MWVASPVVPSDFHGSFGSYGCVPASYASVLLFLRSHVLHPQWWTMVPAGAVSACLAMFLGVSRGRGMFLVPCGGGSVCPSLLREGIEE